MKKLWILFLVYSLLFLTACNRVPAEEPQIPPGLQDTVCAADNGEYLRLPSRVIFEMSVAPGKTYNVYYNKADGKVYPYCYDPLCSHDGGNCLASPGADATIHTYFSEIHFIGQRFYLVSVVNGKIFSFDFDGSDMKKEYDAGYAEESLVGSVWGLGSIAYGDYIYINQHKGDDGNPHVLRFHVGKGEMEDLTAKTGNYISPMFIYNGEVYGTAPSSIVEDVLVRGKYMKSDLALKSMKQIEQPNSSLYFSGSRFFRSAYDENNTCIGIGLYDMKTGKTEVIPTASLGMPEGARPEVACVDETYVYFYNSQKIIIGYQPHPEKEDVTVPIYRNDGKLYRMKHDGTEPVCICDDPEQSFDGYYAVAFDDMIIIKGEYIRIQGDVVKKEGQGYRIGRLGEDGMIREWELIEAVS